PVRRGEPVIEGLLVALAFLLGGRVATPVHRDEGEVERRRVRRVQLGQRVQRGQRRGRLREGGAGALGQLAGVVQLHRRVRYQVGGPRRRLAGGLRLLGR